MAMSLHKCLLHSSLVLLGACTPVNYTSINITYNLSTPAAKVQEAPSDLPPPPPLVVTTTSQALADRCPSSRVEKLAVLTMPALPDFEGVNLKNPSEVEDVLIKNIDELRKALAEQDKKLRKSFAQELDRCLGRTAFPMPPK